MSGIPPAAKIAYAETHELFFHDVPRPAPYSADASAGGGTETALPIL